MKKLPPVCLFIMSIILSGCNDFELEQQITSNYSLLDVTNEVNIQSNSERSTLTKSILLSSTSDEHSGVDISHYQGNILKEIDPKDSLHFLICKATQGDYYIDPDFRVNWREIEELGLLRGAYHFYVCDIDPIKQANHFLRNISDIKSTDIAPVLDIEQGSMSPSTSAKKMEDDVLLFLEEIESKLNRKPILYTDYAFAQEYLKNPKFAHYDLWLAEYSGGEHPKIPITWEQNGFKIWQRSDSYNVDHRKTDLDVYYGQLHKLIK